MFIFKLIGSLGVFAACSIIGYLYGQRYSARFENLIYLKNCIKILETEIVYGSTPLPEALSNVYRKGNPKVSIIFNDIAEDLLANKRYEVINSFTIVMGKMHSELNFTREDVDMILTLGQVLGTSDREDQQKNFNLILSHIDGLIEDAKVEKMKNEKLYKNLGVITGIGLIILLV